MIIISMLLWLTRWQWCAIMLDLVVFYCPTRPRILIYLREYNINGSSVCVLESIIIYNP